ncbi:hypothetical protein ACTXG7_17775 [Mycolicibacterium sp. Dal123E01]|uniref:hypothetical protein n=1 Tax=Mycolicibacterium sp. Dal123E01 TaxID=3457578 RepID=UPI00403E6FCA
MSSRHLVGKVKRRTSIRGVAMLMLAAVVAGLAVVTLRYQPAPPVEAPLAPPTSTAGNR